MVALVEHINRELGANVRLREHAADVAGLPAPLHAFYTLTDGLKLPFLLLYSVAQVRLLLAEPSFGPEWLEFGCDNYVGVCLCRVEPVDGLSLTVEDHETHATREPVYASVVELLRGAYMAFVENPYGRATLTVTALSAGLPLATVVQQLKRLTPTPSGELLRRLRALPASFAEVECALGIDVVRQLQRQGVGCHLSEIRPGR
jgi:hypothetical protein